MDVLSPRLARLGSALASPARAQMLMLLLDGRAHAAVELASVAEVGAATASAHLARLTAAALVTAVPRGRLRLFRLRDPSVAAWLESSAGLVGRRGAPTTPSHLRSARTCYDHLAGELGVALCHQFRARRWIEPSPPPFSPPRPAFPSHLDFALTLLGTNALARLGLILPPPSRRRFAPACLDWSERRPHLGGILGAALLAHLLHHRWLRPHLDSRALEVTSRGALQLHALFGLRLKPREVH